MSDPLQHEWHRYISDMIEFAGRVLIYTDGIDQADFVASRITYDATLRNLELIGEAANHIPDDIRTAHPEIPWRILIAIRNQPINSYLGIDDDALWCIIRDDLPELLPRFRALHDEVQQ